MNVDDIREAFKEVPIKEIVETERQFKVILDVPAELEATGLDFSLTIDKPRKVRCVKCERIIRAHERLDFGDGTGQHIVCP